MNGNKIVLWVGGSLVMFLTSLSALLIVEQANDFALYVCAFMVWAIGASFGGSVINEAGEQI